MFQGVKLSFNKHTMKNNISIKQYLLVGGSWTLVGRLLIAFISLLLSALLAKLLSPGDMGIYFLAFNLATFLAIFARMGLENTLLRFVSEAIGRKQQDYIPRLIQRSLLLVLLAAVVIATGFYAGMGTWLSEHVFHSNTLGMVIGYIAILLILLAIQSLLVEIFRAYQDIPMTVFFNGLITASLGFIFVALYWLISGHASLEQLFPWILVATTVNIILAIWVLSRKFHIFKLSGESSISYRELVNHSWPLLFFSLTLFVMAQSDLWILAAFRSDEEVAIYGAAVRLVSLIGLFFTIIDAIVPPLIARLQVQGQKQRLERILRTTATLVTLPVIAILILFMLFGDMLLGFIFGDYYRSGATVLIILSLGQVVNVYTGSCSYTLVMMGQQRILFLVSIISAAISVCCGLIWVQSYGAIGVAVATTLGMSVQHILALCLVRYRCGIWTHASIKFIPDYKSVKEIFL